MSGPHELRLRVGVLPLFASHVLMPQLPRLRNLHPELHLDLDTAPLPVSRLGEGLDVALTLAQDFDPRFYSRRIGHNRIAVVASQAMANRSEEHTSELQSLMRISYAVFCLKKNTKTTK